MSLDLHVPVYEAALLLPKGRSDGLWQLQLFWILGLTVIGFAGWVLGRVQDLIQDVQLRA